MYGIMMRESGGNPQAFNPNRSTGDQSYGLAQINMLGDLGPARRKQYGLASNEQLLDPLTNAKAAYQLSKGGTDFGAWGIGPNAYRSGAGYDTIKKYVDAFPGGLLPSGQTGLGAPSRTQAGTSAAELFAQAVREGRWKIGRSSLADTAALMSQLRAMSTAGPPAPSASPPQPGAPTVNVEPGGGWGGSYSIAQGLAGLTGLAVTSEKRDRKATASGGVSDHWVGSKNAYAFDLSGDPRQMDAAAKRLLGELGVKWDGKSPIVLNTNLNGYRVQVLYRTNVGGNHFDHIHIGVRRES